jgi:2-C-methyl-D-erythritol 4-phosphate cytidylyltransferase
MKKKVIIPSGGSGSRTGLPQPKQYLSFNGKELIAYTIAAFQNSDLIDEIIIPVQKDYISLINEIKIKYSFTKISCVTEAGSERQYTVKKGLFATECNNDDIILVHDAVRPLIDNRTIEQSVLSAMKYGSTVVAIKARDSLIHGESSVQNYMDRKNIFYAQTPQVFKCAILKEAMLKAEEDNFLGTDEAMLVQRCGYEVKIIVGSSLNFKVTSQDDIKLFKLISENINGLS